MKKINRILFLLSAALGGLTGCVDKNYDLTGDIDLTIGIGGDEFAIPGGASEELMLDDVLEIKEGDMVQTDANGNYYLEQKGDAPTTSEVHINDVEVRTSEITKISRFIDFGIAPDNPGLDDSMIEPIPGDFTPNFELDSDLPEEIVSLEYLHATMTVEFRIHFDHHAIEKFILDDCYFLLPEYLKSDDIDNGVYRVGHVELTNGQPHTIRIPMKGADCRMFPEGTIQGQVLHLEDSLQLCGKATVGANDLKKIPGEEVRVNLTLNTSIYDTKTHSVEAYINPKIDLDIDPISINDVPDFLSDEEVVLDMLNPMIVFDANNQSPADVKIEGTLTSEYNADRNLNPVEVAFSNVEVLSNLTDAPTHYCLWAKEGQQGFLPQDTTFVQVPELPRLIEKIPDRILADIHPQVNQEKCYNIQINHTYTITTDYRIRVPFQFGPNLLIVYKDTLNGWMKDLENYHIKRALLTGTVHSKFPLELQLTAVPLTKEHASDPDDQCFDLEGMTAHVIIDGTVDKAIPAGDLNEPVATAFTVEFVETIPGQMKRLDGIRIQARAMAGQNGGKYLNKRQSVQLTDLRLKVPGGAIINGNNL